jgi:hypothetical protein
MLYSELKPAKKLNPEELAASLEIIQISLGADELVVSSLRRSTTTQIDVQLGPL